jgi:hypothetical protein
MGSNLGEVKLLHNKFTQVQDRSKMFLGMFEGFSKELEKKLGQEEEELGRAKDNVSHHSQEQIQENHRVMEEEELPGDQAEIENDELTDQVSFVLTLGTIRH